MRDILPAMKTWAEQAKPFVLARVVSTWGSAPRRVGSGMAIASEKEFAGSVSGGCVEGAVINEAIEVLKSGQVRLLEFGVDNETAWSVGLSCGGQIRVLLEVFPLFVQDETDREVGTAWLDSLEEGRGAVVISELGGHRGGHSIVLQDGRIVGKHYDRLAEIADEPRTGIHELGGEKAFVHAIKGRQLLLIIGATDIATHLVRLAVGFDFDTVVVDPRPAFAEAGRFDPGPTQILETWPDEALETIPLTVDTYAVLLSHNPRIDDPALRKLLASPVPYIGALGGRKTQEKRRQRMLDAGFPQRVVDRIKGPVGLDIGASSPAEIALSILAEVIATRNTGI
jgi:xanthine dehydrogenase accessory factor